MSPTMLAVLSVAVTAVCTFAMRLVPFVLFGTREKPPAIVSYLGKVLPPAVMAILIIYCLKDVDFGSVNSILPQVISIALVVLLHLWKRNNLISIGAGTVCYMLLIQFVFV